MVSSLNQRFKMVSTHLSMLVLISGIFPFCVNGFPATGSSINDYNESCKSGFTLRHSSSDSTECYIVKPPEKSSEKYNGCIGNTVTIDFYRTFSNKSNDEFEQQDQLNELGYNIFWTDYERIYENGPFVNWRIGDENMGTVENFKSTIFEEWNTSAMGSEPGDCATVDVRNHKLNPARCDQKFPRLCVLPSYQGGKGRLYEYSTDLIEVDIKYARTENDLIIFNITRPTPILDQVWCFHESLTMTERKRMDIVVMNDTQEFGVTAKQNGNYWCLCKNKTNYYSIDSGKVVFVRNKQLYTNTSVMMIKDVELLRYLLDIQGQNLDDLKRKLCPNGKCPRDSDTIITLANSEVLANVKISEELDFDTKILLHVTEGAQILLNYFLKADIVFTRKLLFCEDIHFVPETEISHDVITRTDLCREYRCEGDYIFGAVWKISNIDYCITYEEQQNLLIQTLDDLLKNTIVNTASLESVARMISNLLEKGNNITMPHRIFQGFETLASRVKLPSNNSQVKILLPNMAVVVVDNDNSNTPVIGIRVESADVGSPVSSLDLLTNASTFEDFENIIVLVNVSSALSAHPNTRLSFMVYKNEEAFKPTKQILSVRLGDMSYIGENEHIDFKMRLNNNSNGNVCAHGEFNLTTNGLYWKTKGCQHLKELDVGGLAFCRCNMLSHFAFLSRDDLPTEDPATQLEENNPAEQIQYVMQTMNAMMELPVSTTSLENAATMVDSILKLGENDTIPSEVLKTLEILVSKVILPKNQSQIITIQKPDVNIAIAITDNSVEKSIIGIKITSDPEEKLGSSFEFLTSDSLTEYSEQGKQGILVNMSSILNNQPAGGAQLSFIVYQNDKAFLNKKPQVGDNLKEVNGKVISIQLGNISKLGENEYVDLHFKTNMSKTGNENENKACVFWDFGLGPTGHWSTEGCQFLGEIDLEGWETCRCYHLTHFAQLITIHGVHNQDILNHNQRDFHYRILTHISFYGCILSIVGLFIVVLTGSLFKTWRNVLVHKLRMNLVASIGIMIFNFLFISASDLNDQNSYTNTCFISGIILHYSVLSTFSWMFVIAFFYYQRTANMFKSMTYSDKSILFLALAFGWLFPLIPMIPLLGFDSDSYSNNLSNNFCYPSGNGFWLAVVLPIFIFIIFNTVFLICILYSINETSRSVHAANTREKNFVRDIKRFTFLFYQFGLIWVFGLLSKYILMAYLFCITVSLQGLILSYMFVLGDRNTIKLWLSKFNFSSGEETSYVKSEISSPTNNTVKTNKFDGQVFDQWRKCGNSGKTLITSRVPVCNERMCSCTECSEEAYLKLLSGMA